MSSYVLLLINMKIMLILNDVKIDELKIRKKKIGEIDLCGLLSGRGSLLEERTDGDGMTEEPLGLERDFIPSAVGSAVGIGVGKQHDFMAPEAIQHFGFQCAAIRD